MKSFLEWFNNNSNIINENDDEPVVPASKAIDWKEYRDFNDNSMQPKKIDIKDNMSLEIKHYTNEPAINKLCKTIFNVIYKEIVAKDGLCDENVSKITGQNAWLNKAPIEFDLIIKNTALVFLKSMYVNQERTAKSDNVKYRLYKQSQDLGKHTDLFICSSVNENLLTKVEFELEIIYTGGVDPKCHITIPTICIFKGTEKQNEEAK